MQREQLMDLLTASGVLQEGHFLLSSGLHSDRYLQCAQILQHPERAEKLGREIAEKFSGEKIDLIVGPAMGGIILAYEVARSAGCRGIFTERKDGEMQLRRGFGIEPGERVLLVEDVVTTGKSAREVLQVVEKEGGKVVGISSIVDRSPADLELGVPYRPLLRVEVEVYGPEDCPLCRDGIPLKKPGSRENRE